MSGLKDTFGMDGFDLLIQLAVTVGLVGIEAAALGPGTARHVIMPATWTASILVLGIRRARALRRSPTKGLTTGEMAAARLEELEARLEQLEAAQARVAELEERLDFAERVMVKAASEPQRVPESAR